MKRSKSKHLGGEGKTARVLESMGTIHQNTGGINTVCSRKAIGLLSWIRKCEGADDGKTPEQVAAEAAAAEAARVAAEAAANDRAKWTPEQWQAEIDRVAAKARSEAKTQTKSELEAEAKRLKDIEDGKFKELLDTETAKVKDLEGKAALAVTLAAELNSLIDSEIKDWPKEIKDLDPGTEDVAGRKKWVERVRPLATKLLKLGEAPDTEAGAGGKGGSAAPKSALSAYSEQNQHAIPGKQK